MKFKYLIRTIEKNLNKTHDGTSLGPIRNQLNSFARKYNQLDHEEASIYDSNGNELKHLNQNESDQVDLHEITEYLNKKGIIGCHITHNHPILHYADAVPSPLSIPDMDMLRIKNDEGEYIYQSITCESKNGYRMTLIKNNNFSPKDEREFELQTEYFNESCNAYYEAFQKYNKDWSIAHMKEYYNKGYTLEEFKKESIKHTFEELGTFKNFIYEQRDYDEAFARCNCKLKITRTNA